MSINPTAFEQDLLDLVNRVRADTLAGAARHRPGEGAPSGINSLPMGKVNAPRCRLASLEHVSRKWEPVSGDMRRIKNLKRAERI